MYGNRAVKPAWRNTREDVLHVIYREYWASEGAIIKSVCEIWFDPSPRHEWSSLCPECVALAPRYNLQPDGAGPLAVTG